jgi:ribosomal protein S18 acetylase RimI-like enzyme
MDYKEISIKDMDALIGIWKILMEEHKQIEPELYMLSDIAEEKQREFFTNSINSQEKFLYGAFDENQLVGYAFGWIDGRPPVLEMQIIGNLSDIIVGPNCRSKGIGKGLVDTFMDWCKKRQIKKIQLHVLFDKDSVGFYKKYGFRDYMRQMLIDIE